MEEACIDMLTIRSQQLAVLEEAMAEDFRQRLCAHLRRRFPAECQNLSQSDLELLADEGIARAARHDIQFERDVVRFVDIMILLGRQWEDDPQFAWANELLNDRDFDARTRLEAIWYRTNSKSES